MTRSTFLGKNWADAESKHCWFARDVTAAMLVAKNKSISLL